MLGVARFEAYLRAARSVVAHHPNIDSRQIVHQIWSEEYCKFSDTSTATNSAGVTVIKKIPKTNTRGRGRQRGQQQGRRGQRAAYKGRGRGGRHSLPHISTMPDNHPPTALHSSDEEDLQRDWAQIVASQPTVKYNSFGLPVGLETHTPEGNEEMEVKEP